MVLWQLVLVNEALSEHYLSHLYLHWLGCATGLVRCRQHTSVKDLSMIIRKLLRLIVELYLLYINSWIDIHTTSSRNIDRLMQLDLVLRDHNLLQLRIDLKVHSRRRLGIDLSLVGY